jgi:hypothetical protein
MSDSLVINQWLKDRFGNVTWAELPKYRVSWTTGQTEKRYIKDRQVFSGPIYLRTESGVFTVPKYPFSKDRWVLEKCIAVPRDYDIVGTNHTYEPLFVFETNKGEFLPLEKKAINLIIYFHERPEANRMTPGQMADDEAKIDAAEVAEFEQKIGEMMTPWDQMKDLIE